MGSSAVQRRPEMVALEVAYTTFNAGRTLRDALASDVETAVLPHGGALTLDLARPADPDFNQLFLHDVNVVATSWRAALELARARGIRRLRVHVEPEHLAQASPMLTKAGFRLRWSQSYLVHDLDHQAESPRPTVRRIEHAEADRFLDTLSTSGEGSLPAEVRRARRQFYCTNSFRTWVVELDGQWAGWATLWVPDGGRHGLFGNAFTLQSFRRRGIHQALLSARLEDARRLGLDWVIDDVLHGSGSHRNAERAGFRLATVRTVWEGDVVGQPGISRQ